MSRLTLALSAAAAFCLAAFVLPALAFAAADGFTLPSYVDSTLAGGEPLVLADNVHHTFIYTSHEGTTHLYRTGATSLAPVLFNYRNQVNIWTSTDSGAAWRRVSVPGGFGTNPAENTGFSDPDLTQDEGGRVYNTGINLVNDALFSTEDGGLSWNKGTAQCHDGDRPWLAGAQADHVFMATDANEESLTGSGHTIYESSDGGNSCAITGVKDFGDTPDGGSYTGYGKLYYDHHNGKLVEPVIYTDSDGKADAIGASVWKPGDLTIAPVQAAKTSLFGHFPIVIFDNSDNLYLVWDTDERKADTAGSCEYSPGGGNAPDPLPNHIKMAVSTDFGKTWSAPADVASPASGRVLWPWAVAGDAGRLSIVWYQTDKLVDPDCQPSNVYIYEARVDNATDPATRTIDVSNVSQRPIHQNGICQGGTLCVANGKDRRLGDFFTNAIDPRGCVMIASGDTTQLDPNTGGPLAVSLPIFMSQDSGQKLVGSGNCGPKRKPANPGRPTCADHRAPASTLPLSGFRRRGQRLSFRGHAKDRGCKKALGLSGNGGRLKRVDISLARVLRHGCRFVDAKGRLTKRSTCNKPILMRVHGKRHWRFRIKVHVPPGNYRAVVRAVDAFGNKERPSHRRNEIRFKIR
jgi:hypothetical protein